MTENPEGGQGYQPNSNYGQQGYGYQSNVQQPAYYGQQTGLQPHPKSTTVLVLGILGLVLCWPLGIAAWVIGNNARKEVAANPQAYAPSSQLNIGWGLGIAATVLFILALLFFIISIIGGVFAATNY